MDEKKFRLYAPNTAALSWKNGKVVMSWVRRVNLSDVIHCEQLPILGRKSFIFAKGLKEIMQYRPLSLQTLLEEIAVRQDNHEQENPMEGLRMAFEPGEAIGDEFISLLYRAVQQGLVSGVSFVFRDNGEPEEAVWSGARLTLAGRGLLRRMSK
jgi:hypothetical protein